MDRETIIRMAREAGYQPLNPDAIFDCLQEVFFERFAALVAAAEREACAQICEAKGQVKGGEVFAARIRARGAE